MKNQASADLPLAVFVHLGPNLPDHLLLNLKRHVELFPNIETVLILDHPMKEQISPEIEIYMFSESKEDSDLFSVMQEHSDFNFRNGFWKYTFLRLFALGDFHKSRPTRTLLHIESDVILLPNFPWEKFVGLKSVAWMRVNDFNDVAALVYLPSAVETGFFVSSIRKYAQDDPKTTDMFSMFRYSTENEMRHSYLPSITADSARNGVIVDERQESLLEHFGGYFDPLALGLWYFGQDPKNSYGLTKRYIDQTHHDYFAPAADLTFADEKLFDAFGIQVFALHVHSKDLALFGATWRGALIKVLTDAKNGQNEVSFNLHSFIDSIKDRSLRAHLWILLARIPGVSILRKFTWVEKVKNYFKKLFKIEF
jgi:hypothetical protein